MQLQLKYMDRKRETDDNADDSDRALKRQAAAIDATPFATLPTDVIIKIFLESQLTIKELHKLCNLSRKLRTICNDRKVWEEIFFRRILDKEKEMQEAKRKGELPELLAQLRTTELYGVWKSLSSKFNQFVNLLAIKLVQKFLTKPQVTFSSYSSFKSKSPDLILFWEDKRIRLITRDEKLIDVLRKYYKPPPELDSKTEIQVEFNIRLYHVFAFLLSNRWNVNYFTFRDPVFDKKPLLCSICSAAPSAFACALCETRAYCSHACASLDPIGNHTHAEHDMDLVLPPHIYIGSLAAAQRLPEHIGAVLSVLSRVDKPKIKDRAHLYVEMDDDPEAPIEEYWDDMADFIYKQADIKGRDILVHCHAGMSRSVSAVIYYMIKYRGYTDADAALEMIQRARPVAGPNEGFMEKLRGASRPPAPRSGAGGRGEGKGGSKK